MQIAAGTSASQPSRSCGAPATLVLALFLLSSAASTARAAQFGPPQPLTGQTLGAEAVHATDLDGDGDADLISASSALDKIAWHENVDGLGTFAHPWLISTSADDPRSVFASDLDGDGDQDVLSASAADGKVAWYENLDGLGTFGHEQAITLAAPGASAVFAADLDGDGDELSLIHI